MSRAATVRVGGSRAGHIVMIVADYVPAVGGTTTQTRMHAREFARRGWDVTILTRRALSGARAETLSTASLSDGSDSQDGAGSWKLPVLVAIWWWLLRRRSSISAVSVIMEPDFALCAVWAGLGPSTILTWVTDGDAARTLRGRRGRIRRRALRGRCQVVLTPRMRTELEGIGLTDVHVIPVPVDLERFRQPRPDERAAARRGAEVASGSAIAFIGHLQERKGVDRLLVAVKKLVDDGAAITLLLVGGPVEADDGAYVTGLHHFVSLHHLDQSVRFLGPRSDVLPYLHAADLFCLPSHREGMPNVLLEAMACGLPCVAPRDAGGDAVLGNGAGVVTPSNEPDVLASALESLLSSPARREAVAATALVRVRAEHGIGPVVDGYEALLGRLPSGRIPIRTTDPQVEPLAPVAVES